MAEDKGAGVNIGTLITIISMIIFALYKFGLLGGAPKRDFEAARICKSLKGTIDFNLCKDCVKQGRDFHFDPYMHNSKCE